MSKDEDHRTKIGTTMPSSNATTRAGTGVGPSLKPDDSPLSIAGRVLQGNYMASSAEIRALAASVLGEQTAQHVYEGKPDARQSDDPTMKTSRFRPMYRALEAREKALHDNIKAQAASLEMLIERTPPSREQSLALTKLEESVMWAIKGLTK